MRKKNKIKQSLTFTTLITMFFKHSASLMTALRYFYETLLELEVDKLLHLSMVLINSLFEKEDYSDKGFNRISFKMFVLTC